MEEINWEVAKSTQGANHPIKSNTSAESEVMTHFVGISD